MMSNVKELFNKIRFDKRFFTFLFFLFIAIVFWFLNSLGRKYTTEITIPVEFVNFPDDKLLVNDPPEQLTIKVNGFGYALLRYKMNMGLKTYEVDFNNKKINLVQGEDSITYHLLTDQFVKNISGKLDPDNKVINIYPERIELQLATITKRKLPVNLNMMIDYEKQYKQKGEIVIEPDSVVVNGPESIIDSMECVETENIKLNNVSEDQEVNIGLKKIDKVSFHEKSVTVIVPVEQFTEATVAVPVSIINLPDTVRLKTFPNEVKISFLVSLSDYELYDKDYFKVVVDYNEIQKGLNKISIELVKKPEYVYSVKLHPQRVEYIIEEK